MGYNILNQRNTKSVTWYNKSEGIGLYMDALFHTPSHRYNPLTLQNFLHEIYNLIRQSARTIASLTKDITFYKSRLLFQTYSLFYFLVILHCDSRRVYFCNLNNFCLND